MKTYRQSDEFHWFVFGQHNNMAKKTTFGPTCDVVFSRKVVCSMGVTLLPGGVLLRKVIEIGANLSINVTKCAASAGHLQRWWVPGGEALKLTATMRTSVYDVDDCLCDQRSKQSFIETLILGNG